MPTKKKGFVSPKHIYTVFPELSYISPRYDTLQNLIPYDLFFDCLFFLQFMNVSFNVFLWAIVVKTKFNISSNNFVILF